MPQSAPEFERQWRRCEYDNDAQLALLRSVSPCHMQSLFKVELKSPLLAAILDSLASATETQSLGTGAHTAIPVQICETARHFNSAGARALPQPACCQATQESTQDNPSQLRATMDLLAALPHCGRFQLARKLLPKPTLSRFSLLLGQLKRSAENCKCIDADILMSGVDSLASAFEINIEDDT